jgi:hypothetical protein
MLVVSIGKSSSSFFFLSSLLVLFSFILVNNYTTSALAANEVEVSSGCEDYFIFSIPLPLLLRLILLDFV